MNHQASWKFDEVIASDTRLGNKIVLQIVENMQKIGWEEKLLFGIHMALEEAIINAIKHGNKEQADKNVHIIVKTTHEEFYLKVTDEGPGFNPDDVPDPTAVENLEIGSGRGLMLMNHYMDEVNYNEKGNSLEIRKRRVQP